MSLRRHQNKASFTPLKLSHTSRVNSISSTNQSLSLCKSTSSLGHSGAFISPKQSFSTKQHRHRSQRRQHKSVEKTLFDKHRKLGDHLNDQYTLTDTIPTALSQPSTGAIPTDESLYRSLDSFSESVQKLLLDQHKYLSDTIRYNRSFIGGRLNSVILSTYKTVGIRGMMWIFVNFQSHANPLHWTRFLNILSSTGFHQDVLYFFDLFLKTGQRVDDKILSEVLKSYIKLGDSRQIVTFLSTMQHYGLKPDINSIKGYCRVLIDDPNVSDYSLFSLIQMYSTSTNDVHFRGGFSDLATKHGDWGLITLQFELVCHSLLHQGSVPSETIIHFIRAAIRSRRFDLLYGILQHLQDYTHRLMTNPIHPLMADHYLALNDPLMASIWLSVTPRPCEVQGKMNNSRFASFYYDYDYRINQWLAQKEKVDENTPGNENADLSADTDSIASSTEPQGVTSSPIKKPSPSSSVRVSDHGDIILPVRTEYFPLTVLSMHQRFTHRRLCFPDPVILASRDPRHKSHDLLNASKRDPQGLFTSSSQLNAIIPSLDPLSGLQLDHGDLTETPSTTPHQGSSLKTTHDQYSALRQSLQARTRNLRQSVLEHLSTSPLRHPMTEFPQQLSKLLHGFSQQSLFAPASQILSHLQQEYMSRRVAQHDQLLRGKKEYESVSSTTVDILTGSDHHPNKHITQDPIDNIKSLLKPPVEGIALDTILNGNTCRNMFYGDSTPRSKSISKLLEMVSDNGKIPRKKGQLISDIIPLSFPLRATHNALLSDALLISPSNRDDTLSLSTEQQAADLPFSSNTSTAYGATKSQLVASPVQPFLLALTLASNSLFSPHLYAFHLLTGRHTTVVVPELHNSWSEAAERARQDTVLKKITAQKPRRRRAATTNLLLSEKLHALTSLHSPYAAAPIIPSDPLPTHTVTIGEALCRGLFVTMCQLPPNQRPHDIKDRIKQIFEVYATLGSSEEVSHLHAYLRSIADDLDMPALYHICAKAYINNAVLTGRYQLDPQLPVKQEITSQDESEMADQSSDIESRDDRDSPHAANAADDLGEWPTKSDQKQTSSRTGDQKYLRGLCNNILMSSNNLIEPYQVQDLDAQGKKLSSIGGSRVYGSAPQPHGYSPLESIFTLLTAPSSLHSSLLSLMAQVKSSPAFHVIDQIHYASHVTKLFAELGDIRSTLVWTTFTAQSIQAIKIDAAEELVYQSDNTLRVAVNRQDILRDRLLKRDILSQSYGDFDSQYYDSVHEPIAYDRHPDEENGISMSIDTVRQESMKKEPILRSFHDELLMFPQSFLNPKFILDSRSATKQSAIPLQMNASGIQWPDHFEPITNIGDILRMFPEHLQQPARFCDIALSKTDPTSRMYLEGITSLFYAASLHDQFMTPCTYLFWHLNAMLEYKYHLHASGNVDVTMVNAEGRRVSPFTLNTTASHAILEQHLELPDIQLEDLWARFISLGAKMIHLEMQRVKEENTKQQDLGSHIGTCDDNIDGDDDDNLEGLFSHLQSAHHAKQTGNTSDDEVEKRIDRMLDGDYDTQSSDIHATHTHQQPDHAGTTDNSTKHKPPGYQPHIKWIDTTIDNIIAVWEDTPEYTDIMSFAFPYYIGSNDKAIPRSASGSNSNHYNANAVYGPLAFLTPTPALRLAMTSYLTARYELKMFQHQCDLDQQQSKPVQQTTTAPAQDQPCLRQQLQVFHDLNQGIQTYVAHHSPNAHEYLNLSRSITDSLSAKVEKQLDFSMYEKPEQQSLATPSSYPSNIPSDALLSPAVLVVNPHMEVDIAAERAAHALQEAHVVEGINTSLVSHCSGAYFSPSQTADVNTNDDPQAKKAGKHTSQLPKKQPKGDDMIPAVSTKPPLTRDANTNNHTSTEPDQMDESLDSNRITPIYSSGIVPNHDYQQTRYQSSPYFNALRDLSSGVYPLPTTLPITSEVTVHVMPPSTIPPSKSSAPDQPKTTQYVPNRSDFHHLQQTSPQTNPVTVPKTRSIELASHLTWHEAIQLSSSLLDILDLHLQNISTVSLSIPTAKVKQLQKQVRYLYTTLTQSTTHVNESVQNLLRISLENGELEDNLFQPMIIAKAPSSDAAESIISSRENVHQSASSFVELQCGAYHQQVREHCLDYFSHIIRSNESVPDHQDPNETPGGGSQRIRRKGKASILESLWPMLSNRPLSQDEHHQVEQLMDDIRSLLQKP